MSSSQLGAAQLGNLQLGGLGNSNTISPAGIASGEAFGSATFSGGSFAASITPSGIPSEESVGAAVFINNLVLFPSGIPTGEAWGSPALYPGTARLYPSGIASEEAWGTHIFRGGTQYIVPTGIESMESLGFGAFSRVGLAYQGLRIWVAGRRHRVLMRTVTINQQLNGRSTASFTLTCPPGANIYRPLVGQTVKIMDGERNEFYGIIERVTEKFMNPRVNTQYEWECSCVDWANILDHRIVSGTYGPGTAVSIVRSIITTFAAGESITTSGVTTSAYINDEQDFQQKTVTECLNRICDITGDIWYFNTLRDLQMHPPSAGPAAPISITGTSQNIRDIAVTSTLVNYGNVSILRTDTDLGDPDV